MLLDYKIQYNGSTWESRTPLTSINLLNQDAADSITTITERTLHCRNYFTPSDIRIGEYTIACHQKVMVDNIVITTTGHPTDITVALRPTKTSYKSGEVLRISGLKVVDNFGNDVTSKCTTVPANGEKLLSSDTTITVIYNNELTTNFTITVSRLPIGGRIFYIHSDNGATYKFYDSNNVELTTLTVAGLATASTYEIISGTKSTDKFYVFYNCLYRNWYYWGKWGTITYAQSIGIGSGSINTYYCLSQTGWETDSIFKKVENVDTSGLEGCKDWYIGSIGEIDKLRQSGLVPSWFTASDNDGIWSSSEVTGEYSNTHANVWSTSSLDWAIASKGSLNSYFFCRSF